MSQSTIRNALGILQDEPDNEQAWSDLREALGFTAGDATIDPGDLGANDLATLLEAARKAHEMRREYEAVADLLEIEAALATGEREAALVAELARVRDDVLLDDAAASKAYRRLLALRPNDTAAAEALERSEQKRAKWKELAQRYYTESKTAGDASFKSSLLVSAAEIAYRYGRPEAEAQTAADDESSPKSVRSKKKKKEKPPAKPSARTELLEKIVGLLRSAIELDQKNRRAVTLLERILRDETRWEELAGVLEAFAAEVSAKDEKLAALVRLARVAKKKLKDLQKTIGTYEKVLDLSPGHAEATSALVDYFTEREMWDHLVSLYEG